MATVEEELEPQPQLGVHPHPPTLPKQPRLRWRPSNLTLRLFTAMLLIPPVVAVCYVGGLWFVGLVIVFSVLAINEFLIASLVVGKTVGVTACSMLGEKLGFSLPNNMGMRDVAMAGFIAALGLTVALFVAGAAYPVDLALQGQAKMGALFSGFVGLVAILIGKAMGFGNSASGNARSAASSSGDSASLPGPRRSVPRQLVGQLDPGYPAIMPDVVIGRELLRLVEAGRGDVDGVGRLVVPEGELRAAVAAEPARHPGAR